MERESRSPISSLCESEDDSVSSASPMSISSAEASSPYTDDTYSSDYTDHHSNASHHYVVDSPCSSPSPSSLSYHDDEHHRWWHCNPYNHCKSVRWYRDDNGLWSEQSRTTRHRSPYHRPATHRHHAKDQCEALIQAVNRSDYPQLRDILAKNHTNLNILGVEGDSPLHRCCRQGNLEMVKLLVGHGADPELTNRDGWSPLHLAVHCGYQDVVLYLLSLSRR